MPRQIVSFKRFTRWGIFAALLPLFCVSLRAEVRLTDAAERGTFNIGPAEGKAAVVPGPSGKSVLRFDFKAPAGSVAGVWTKGYPAGVNAGSVSGVRAGARSAGGAAARVSVSLEIKGSKAAQTVPLAVRSDGTLKEEPLDWAAVGDLKEIVFVVTPPAGQGAEGALLLDFEFVSAAPAARASGARLAEAAERGVFNIGASEGDAQAVFDQTAGHDVLKLDYRAPAGTMVGVWTKGYSSVSRRSANAVEFAVRAGGAGKAAVTLELKGGKGVQTIPVTVGGAWGVRRAAVDWDLIGDLKEAVFVVAPAAGGSAAGTLWFDLAFVQAAAPAKSAAPAKPAPASASAGPAAFNLLAAKESGVFNIGASRGAVKAASEEGRPLLRFDYKVSSGSVVGVWTKGYPAAIGPATANAARVGVKAPSPESLADVAVSVEIKGEKAAQSAALDLKPGWNTLQLPVDWGALGALGEAVFVVSPKAGSGKKSVSGTLLFELEFVKVEAPVRRSPPVGGKVLVAFAAAALLALLKALLSRYRDRVGRPPRRPLPEDEPATSSARLARDLLNGFSFAGIAALSLAIYAFGPVESAEMGFEFLAAGVFGGALAELLKYGRTRRHLTPVETFQNVFLTGLLAATASGQTVLQAPAGWPQVLMASHLTAALACAVYHGANAASILSRGRHLDLVGGSLIVGTPYLFGGLLLLENASLLRGLTDGLTAGALAGWPRLLEESGRFLVVFLFNEAVANGISLAVRGKVLRAARAHLLLFFASLAVVLAPSVADLAAAPAVAALGGLPRAVVSVLAAMLSQAGLWVEIYLLTGLVLDGTRGVAPSTATVADHASTGLRKGLAYSGLVMAILQGLHLLLDAAPARALLAAAPLSVGLGFGALAFPLVKNIIETFDGSMSFFERLRYSYRQTYLYLRGAVAGFALAWGMTHGLFETPTSGRLLFGFLWGLAASAGVSLLRDLKFSVDNRGRVMSWKLYLVDGLLGGFIGAAAAFYLDTAQVSVVVEKFKLYNAASFAPQSHTIYPLLSKWGRIDLGPIGGGVKLLFNEVLAGVISWSIAAWLFAVNRAFMEAFFQKDKAPIKFLLSRAGMVDLVKHMIQVLRWGLWMAPIINTFLRMMGEATWYNQDGAVRTLIAAFKSLTLSPADFQAWSLNLFIALLAYDSVRILIWLDHMGLRVATLVNLSFMGMDRLDEKIARFLGPAAAQRYIPEGVKRFTTWAPLLIPFYIPRGADWDHAWSTAEAMQKAAAAGGDFASALRALPAGRAAALALFAALGLTALSWAAATLRRRSARRREKVFEISNREYRVTVKENGESFGTALQKGYDVNRRSYDAIDPCGRALFLVDAAEDPGSASRAWPVLGNFPREKRRPSHVENAESALRVVNTSHGLRATVDISLPDEESTVELWTVTIENLDDRPRPLKIVPYLEWVLDRPDADRGHTLYGRLFPEMEYLRKENAVLAWQKHTKTMGLLAADVAPEGFLISRMDFIGRARSVWDPRALETLAFLDAADSPPCPTFDPIGSLMVDLTAAANEVVTLRLLVGCAKNKETALNLIHRHLSPQAAPAPKGGGKAKPRKPLIGHGEVPPDTPQPYYEYSKDGDTLRVRTPYTPRPFDHALSNAAGHFVMVTNRGLHTTANGNSQQNRVTPDWPDTVTREIPGEAIYLYDADADEWFSPTHHPLNDYAAENTCEFGVDGTAVFRMTKDDLSTELSVFVPPADPVGVYLLTIRNRSAKPRRLRVAPYFQIVLAGQPEWAGPLQVHHDAETNGLFFENPRNTFRTGPAFAGMSLAADRVETKRGRFFGAGRGAARPVLVEKGTPDEANVSDERPVAALLGAVEVPARGERTVAVVMGQTGSRAAALELIRRYADESRARAALAETRRWWLSLMQTVRVETNAPDFDRYLNWLKYQAVAERLWARRGFYQTSGAFGFRDQLQDSVNLAWVDPLLARKQILLHASQQFIEGDVVHWFHTLHDGRTAFSNRSHASDNLLWLAWAAVEYVRSVGDDSILDELTTYLRSETPFLPLPKNKHGWGTIYHRSTRGDTLYRHCLRALDLVLDKRMGANGLPLIGTGDWNDGLDEIGSEGRGESVWLGFFLHYILSHFVSVIERREGAARRDHYLRKLKALEAALENTWREDRYLRAIHDDGTEIGVKDSGVWEIDALTAAWAVMAGINHERAETVFQTALRVLEKDNVILLGWPALREDTTPYLGRSSHYPEGVRENGMYCHGVQWLVKAARILAEHFQKNGDAAKAAEYRATSLRLWMKIAPVSHMGEIELYGGQPNKQAADLLTTFDQGRMIWHGYTGAAGWMLRQAIEGVVGAALADNEVVLPDDLSKPRGDLKVAALHRNLATSPFRTRPD